VKRILLFPYHPDIELLVEHKDYIKDFQIIGLISYKEDAKRIRLLIENLALETMPYEQLIQVCDAVVVLDNYRRFETEKYYRVINDAVANHKEVLVTPLAQTQLDLASYEGKYQLLELLPAGVMDFADEYNSRKASGYENRIYEIETPIIAVMGQGINCCKFETQLLVKEVLEEEYTTITVTSNALGALFGCYTIPAFLFADVPFQEKIIKFNYYIRKISKAYDPDVILIGIPEGVAPFEREEFHHFAEYPLVISNAVSIDMAILCTYFVQGTKLKEGLKKVVEFCQHKLNILIGAISISKTSFEIPAEMHERIVFEYLDRAYLDKYYPDINSINLPLINLLNRNEASETIKASLKRLQENVSAI
jgi:peptide maturation system protein (TIGR04066 family)